MIFGILDVVFRLRIVYSHRRALPLITSSEYMHRLCKKSDHWLVFSQGSAATCLKCDLFLGYDFIANLPSNLVVKSTKYRSAFSEVIRTYYRRIFLTDNNGQYLDVYAAPCTHCSLRTSSTIAVGPIEACFWIALCLCYGTSSIRPHNASTPRQKSVTCQAYTTVKCLTVYCQLIALDTSNQIIET